MNKQLALFDFDGTITTKDSLVDFIQFALGGKKYYLGLFKLSPILLAYSIKLISNHSAKERLISYFFKGYDAINFQKLATQYSLQQIDKITKPKAIEKIKWHQNHGHKVVIVSASMECWLKAWCEKNHIDLIATRLEMQNNRITGKFATKNCYGKEKVNRITKHYDLSRYNVIYAYGDRHGDKEMLTMASKQFYKCF